PTPSRSTSPDPIPTPTSQRKEVHGFQALAEHARSELGFGFADYDVAMGALSEESGDETETEGGTNTRWINQDRSSPSASVTQQHRSHSLTSLHSYFLSPLSASAVTESSSATVKDAQTPPALLRRTSSFTGPGLSPGEDSATAWGGEFEGFEAALSYWRRILRRMRGL
ncbi:hypothetical protein P7C70_g300, partial [Phenoliferia sp. Uapishka_3]